MWTPRIKLLTFLPNPFANIHLYILDRSWELSPFWIKLLLLCVWGEPSKVGTLTRRRSKVTTPLPLTSKGEKVRESSLLGGVVNWHQCQRQRLLTFGVRDHWHWCQNEKLSQLVKQFMSRCSQHQCKCQQATNYVLDKSRNIVVWRRSTLKSAKSLPDSKYTWSFVKGLRSQPLIQNVRST